MGCSRDRYARSRSTWRRPQILTFAILSVSGFGCFYWRHFNNSISLTGRHKPHQHLLMSFHVLDFFQQFWRNMYANLFSYILLLIIELFISLVKTNPIIPQLSFSYYILRLPSWCQGTSQFSSFQSIFTDLDQFRNLPVNRIFRRLSCLPFPINLL
jgi:hypothetical protein